MQTFLPSADFTASAQVLDRQRLGKQRVENLQIMSALLVGPGAGWWKHPVVQMWRGFECSLYQYHREIVAEWLHRGYRDTCGPKGAALHRQAHPGRCQAVRPPWLGDPQLHAAYRSTLLRKDPEHYGPVWPSDPHDLVIDHPPALLGEDPGDLS